jgi:hypothetical protein
MIGRLALVLGRGSRVTRWLTVGALGVVVLLVVASALAPAPRPSHRLGPPTTGSVRRSLRSPTVPRGSPLVSAGELSDARRVAARFLVGYLPFLYGRGSARSVEGVTPSLRVELTRMRALVTPVERRRHARVVSLTAVGQAHGAVVATALVDDGGVTTYALRITVRELRAGWLVTRVDGR